MKRKNTRRGPRPRRTPRGAPPPTKYVLSKSLTYPVRLTLRGAPLNLTNNIGTSTYAGSPYTTFDNLTDFANSSAAIVGAFASYRLVKIVAKFTCLTTASGSSAFGFCEDINAISNRATFASDSRALIRPNSQDAQVQVRTISWTSSSYDSLSFHEVSTTISPAPVSFIAYTDAASFFTPIAGATSTFFRVDFDITVDVRGLNF